MGVVFEAEDVRLGRHVAVKFLPEEAATAREALERFGREARAASALNHPHICTIYDLGDENGSLYRHGAHEGADARRKDRGQAYAHRAGGDARRADRRRARGGPPRGHRPPRHQAGQHLRHQRGEAKLLDFGLAKLGTGKGPMGTSTSRRSERSRSPKRSLRRERPWGRYRTCRPNRPGAERSTPGAIFSRCVVLYEMATGVLPHRGQSAVDTIDSILNRQPVPPVRFNADLPEAFERIIAKALEKDPALRYQGAAEMKADLKRLLRDTGGVSLAAMPVGAERKRPFPKALAVGAAVVAVVALAVSFVVLRRRAPAPGTESGGPTRIAVLPFENLGTAEDAYFADGMTDEVRSKLASLPQLAVIARNSAIGYRGTTKAPQVIAKELDVRYLLSGPSAGRKTRRARTASGWLRSSSRYRVRGRRPRAGRTRSTRSWKTCSACRARSRRGWPGRSR